LPSQQDQKTTAEALDAFHLPFEPIRDFTEWDLAVIEVPKSLATRTVTPLQCPA